MSGQGRVRRLAALAMAVTLLAGCIDAPVPSATPTPTPSPEPTPTTITYQLGATIWYEGLIIHVDDAVATLDQRGGPVEVSLRIENPGDDEGELDGRIRLLVDVTSSDPPVEATRESKVPTIPAHGIAPQVRGARVAVQRRVGKRWVPVHRGRASRVGRGRIGYSAVVQQARRSRQYRVVVRPGTRAYALGMSRIVTVPGLPRRHRGH